MSSTEHATRWVADERIGWRILLTASLPSPPHADVVGAHLAALATRQQWPAPGAVRTASDTTTLRTGLVATDPAPLLAGIAGHDLVVSAHHAALDGLGLLSVLNTCGLAPVASGARGIGERPPGAGVARTVARRLGEAAFWPPAAITRPVAASGQPGQRSAAGDVMVEREITGSFRTAALVHAAARAVVQHEAARGRSARHVAIAVGASRAPSPDDDLLRDRSALLRLRDVERLDLAAVERALRVVPPQTPPAAATYRRWTPVVDRAASATMRLLAPRLGSTLLVSHLGEVSAPHIDRLSFHPVTAGGTGISLGAVGHRGRTVVTLRARAAGWDDNGLEQLLEAVVSLL